MSHRQRIYQELRRQILDWELAPGEPLSEAFVAERLGGSRTPAREALQQLAREGLVKSISGRGAFVAEISIPDIIELFQMREALETLLVRLASRSAAKGQLEPLVAELERVRAEIEDGDPTNYYELTSRIDHLLASVAGNSRLEQALRDIWGQVYRARHLASRDVKRLLRSNAETQDIVRAVVDGDEQAAEAACRIHISNSLRNIMESSTGVAVAGATSFGQD